MRQACPVLWERAAPVTPTTTLWAAASPGPQTRAQLACVPPSQAGPGARRRLWGRDCHGSVPRLAGRRRDVWVIQLSHSHMSHLPRAAPTLLGTRPSDQPFTNCLRLLQGWPLCPASWKATRPPRTLLQRAGRPEPPPTDSQPSTQKEWSRVRAPSHQPPWDLPHTGRASPPSPTFAGQEAGQGPGL